MVEQAHPEHAHPEHAHPEHANAAQAQAWNGEGGRTWVDLQATLDQVLEPFEELVVDAVAAAAGTAGTPLETSLETPLRVLDVGCGAGATTLAVAERFGSRVRCTGIDISVPMIDRARTRADARSLPVRFLVGDAQTPSLIHI
ncbi:class I SAM-dependent methyltransferase [Mycolicibacterium palauense]|uniref:class I SAM-dependent methyltransferase n=1 Tax=Mycolicibacterium palauense TaxID=2034511 RepID=UPI000BFEFB99|nr:class I SAM-dependent methyltransferase [Mycolicibacterium palauense]